MCSTILRSVFSGSQQEKQWLSPLDVGDEIGSPGTGAYKLPNTVTGKIGKVTIGLM